MLLPSFALSCNQCRIAVEKGEKKLFALTFLLCIKSEKIDVYACMWKKILSQNRATIVLNMLDVYANAPINQNMFVNHLYGLLCIV